VIPQFLFLWKSEASYSQIIVFSVAPIFIESRLPRAHASVRHCQVHTVPDAAADVTVKAVADEQYYGSALCDNNVCPISKPILNVFACPKKKKGDPSQCDTYCGCRTCLQTKFFGWAIHTYTYCQTCVAQKS
jgi:hypothetical protein